MVVVAAGAVDVLVLAKLNVEEMGEERSDSTPSSRDDEFETSLEKAGHFRFIAARLSGDRDICEHDDENCSLLFIAPAVVVVSAAAADDDEDGVDDDEEEGEGAPGVA